MADSHTIWEDLYGISSNTTSISTASNAAKGIPLLGHPPIEMGQNIIDQRKAVGTSYRQTGAGKEFQQGTRMPTTTWEYDASSANMSRVLWSFFQKTAFQDSGANNIKFFIPHGEDTGCDVWLNLVKKLAASGTAESHRMVGAIAESITLSANENEPLKISATFRGCDLTESGGDVLTSDSYGSYDVGHNVESDTFTFDAVAPYLWQNASVTLGGTTINIPGFTLTMTNGAASKFYDNETPQKHILGEFAATGSFQLPWAATAVGGNVELNNFVNGTTSRLVIKWGDNEIASAASDFSIIAHIRLDNITTEGDSETVQNISFVCVSDYTSSSQITSSASTIAIAGAATVTGTNTEIDDDVAAGDLLIASSAAASGDRTPRMIRTIASNTSFTVYPVFSGSESGLIYKAFTTPLTLTLRDDQSISNM